MTLARPPMLYGVASAGMAPQIATRDSSGTWRQFMGIPENGIDVPSSLRDFGRVPADEAWVYRCLTLKATFAQGVPLRVEVRDGSGWTPAEATSRNGAALDLQSLLDDANPDEMTGADLKAFTVGGLGAWGETYWRKVRGRLGGAPQELYWRPSTQITPKVGARWIDSYEYRDRGGNVEIWPARDVVPFRTLNLEDPTRGLSPLSAARYEIATNRQAAEWNAATLANWAIPPMAWVIPKDADFDKADQSLVQRALRALRGPRKAGKVPVLPQGLEPRVLSLSQRDADWLASRKVSRMTVCAVLGVPLVLAGDDEKNTVYANLRDAERIFARFMIGELDWMADRLDSWLVPDFDPRPRARRDIRVRWDYSGIEALQEPTADAKRIGISEVQTGIQLPDEYRKRWGVGGGAPLPEGLGQIPVRLSTLTVVDPSDPLAAAPGQADAGGQDPAPELPDEGSDAIRALGRRLYAHPAIRAWIADPSSALDAEALIGRPVEDRVRSRLEDGIRRRLPATALAEYLEV